MAAEPTPEEFQRMVVEGGRMDPAEAAYLRLLRASGGKTEPEPEAVADQVALMAPGDAAAWAAARATAVRVRASRATLARLLLDPGIQQRTAPWYAARGTLLTASDLGQALGEGLFGTRDDLLWAKVERTTKADPLPGAFDPFSWGIMFEPIVAQLYAATREDVPLHDFGLLRHRTVDCFGCSPDGVSELGVMLEIKAPIKRQLTGLVKAAYYMQVQGQMEVCDLDACDFIECKIACYNNLEHMAADETLTDAQRGAVLIGPGKVYSYSPWGQTPAQVGAWLAASGVDASDREQMKNVRLWFQRTLLVHRIPRDRAFWEDALPKVRAFWDDVERLRAEGATRPTKPARAPRVYPADAPPVTKASYAAAFAKKGLF